MVPVVRLKEFSMQKIEKEKSDLIWRLKGIAIFTVFFAHVPYNGPYEWISYIYNLRDVRCSLLSDTLRFPRL